MATVYTHENLSSDKRASLIIAIETKILHLQIKGLTERRHMQIVSFHPLQPMQESRVVPWYTYVLSEPYHFIFENV